MALHRNHALSSQCDEGKFEIKQQNAYNRSLGWATHSFLQRLRSHLISDAKISEDDSISEELQLLINDEKRRLDYDPEATKATNDVIIESIVTKLNYYEAELKEKNSARCSEFQRSMQIFLNNALDPARLPLDDSNQEDKEKLEATPFQLDISLFKKILKRELRIRTVEFHCNHNQLMREESNWIHFPTIKLNNAKIFNFIKDNIQHVTWLVTILDQLFELNSFYDERREPPSDSEYKAIFDLLIQNENSEYEYHRGMEWRKICRDLDDVKAHKKIYQEIFAYPERARAIWKEKVSSLFPGELKMRFLNSDMAVAEKMSDIRRTMRPWRRGCCYYNLPFPIFSAYFGCCIKQSK